MVWLCFFFFDSCIPADFLYTTCRPDQILYIAFLHILYVEKGHQLHTSNLYTTIIDLKHSICNGSVEMEALLKNM